IAKGIVVIEDGYAIRNYCDGSAGRSRARGVSGVDGVNAGCASGDEDIDTRLKRQVDGGAAEPVVGIVGDRGGKGARGEGRGSIVARCTGSVAGRIKWCALRQRRFRYA